MYRSHLDRVVSMYVRWGEKPLAARLRFLEDWIKYTKIFRKVAPCPHPCSQHFLTRISLLKCHRNVRGKILPYIRFILIEMIFLTHVSARTSLRDLWKRIWRIRLKLRLLKKFGEIFSHLSNKVIWVEGQPYTRYTEPPIQKQRKYAHIYV